MKPARAVRMLATTAVAVLTVAFLCSPAQAAPAQNNGPGRYLVVARTAADFAALRDSAVRAGAKVVSELPQVNLFVISGSSTVRNTLQADPRTQGVAADHIETITSAERPAPNLSAPGLRSAKQVDLPPATAAPRAAAINPDPAFSDPGLQ